MGPERFADVVERFTGVGAGEPPAETVKRWQEELERGFRRLQNFHGLVTNPVEPRTGQTPRVEVYKRNKSRLYRYESSRTHRIPVLFVPNLGISRPYIFDLLPGGSFVEHMTRQGFDFYMLDWGVFGPEDNDLTVEDCVTRILPRMVRRVLETSGTDALSVLGYCMGAPISASFVATHPEVPVRNFVNMAGPIDFAKVGLFGLWLGKQNFNVDRFVDTLGSVPADLVKAGFKLLKPTMDLSTNLNLWWNLWNDKYVEGFQALSKWANEYVAFPGEFFRQWCATSIRTTSSIAASSSWAAGRCGSSASRVPSSSWARRRTTSRPPSASGRSSTPSAAATSSTSNCPAATSPSSPDGEPPSTAGRRSRAGSEHARNPASPTLTRSVSGG